MRVTTSSTAADFWPAGGAETAGRTKGLCVDGKSWCAGSCRWSWKSGQIPVADFVDQDVDWPSESQLGAVPCVGVDRVEQAVEVF